MTQKTDLSELQDLKNKFNLIGEKLDKQRIINKNLIEESMHNKISHIEKRFYTQLAINVLGVPFLFVVFRQLQFHGGFILLMALLAFIQFLVAIRCYQILEPKKLASLSMTSATEKVVRFRKLRKKSNRVLLLPIVVLVVWAILIACDYRWNLPVILVCSILFIVSVVRDLHIKKRNSKRIDEILQSIHDLREE